MFRKITFLVFPIIILAKFNFAQTGWFQLTSGITTDLNSVSFFDETIGLAAGDGGVILKTTDAGSNWTPLTSGSSSDFYDVILIDQSNGFVVGSGGTILKTTNVGISWNSITSNVGDNLFSISINGNFGIIGGSSQAILISSDGGNSWSVNQTGFFGGGFWGTSVVSPNTAFVAGENSIFQPMAGRTTDNGTNWDFTPFYLNSNEGRLQDCFFFDQNSGITVASVWDGQGAVSRTSNGGSDWITTLFSDALYGVDFPSSIFGYAVGFNGLILKTTNGGLIWESQTSNTTSWLKDVNFVNTETGFAVGEAGTILKTNNGGVIPVELTSFSVMINQNNAELFWTTETETNNSGFEIQRKQVFSPQSAISNEEWKATGFINGNGTTTEAQSYSYVDKNLEVGKYQYRLKQIDFNGSFEYSKIIEVTVGAPTVFSLEQNYPNPFNPSTTIRFFIPDVMRNFKDFSSQAPRNDNTIVTLKVYDILGNEVATLVNEEKPAGIYEIEFDASELNSGVYFYTLKSGNFISTKKMILLK